MAEKETWKSKYARQAGGQKLFQKFSSELHKLYQGFSRLIKFSKNISLS